MIMVFRSSASALSASLIFVRKLAKQQNNQNALWSDPEIGRKGTENPKVFLSY